MTRPPRPKLVLMLAVLAPGAGHLLLGRTGRALGILFFTAFFAALTWKFCPPDRSIIGRTAGGLFVWALSIPDAYRSASLRWFIWAHPETAATS